MPAPGVTAVKGRVRQRYGSKLSSPRPHPPPRARTGPAGAGAAQPPRATAAPLGQAYGAKMSHVGIERLHERDARTDAIGG